MPEQSSIESTKRWNVALIIALAAGLWLIWHYVALIAISFLGAYVFGPLYKRYLSLLRGRRNTAAVATVLTSFVIVLVPLLLIGLLVVLQTTNLVTAVQHNFSASNLSAQDVLQRALDSINRLIAHFTGNSSTLTYQQTINWLRNAIIGFGSWLLRAIGHTAQSLPRFITNLFLYTFITGSLLAHQDKFTQAIVNLNPMGDNVSRLYLDKIRAMTKAMLAGQFITALFQGAESSAVFALLGYGRYFFVMLLVLTFISIIPLGAGIITIPLGIVMIATGNVVGGIIVILNHLLVVSTIDNFTRPKFASNDAYLPTALTLLATFAGLARFGFFGIIYGPIIMILVITTIQVYLEIHGHPAMFSPKRHRRRRNLFARRRPKTR